MTVVADPVASTTVRTDTVCAVVVAFFPDRHFCERVRKVLPQVDALVVADNTPGETRERWTDALGDDAACVHIIENRINLGVAAALNQGLAHALRLGCRWLLALDQDTDCYPDMVSTLIRAGARCVPAPGVVGANYFDPRNGRPKVGVAGEDEFLEQKTVITSGSLIDVALAHRIGGFREDYFIDQVDHEFCLRVRACGQRVVITRRPVMTHSVGGPNGARLPFLRIVLAEHSALRKYYITRNTLVTVANYWRREPQWCLRRLTRLLLGAVSMTLLEKHGFTKLRAFATGVADAMQRRMGPCRRKWLARTG